jgi:ribonuclease HI
LIIWGVWLARNTLIFKEVSVAPEITTLKSIAIYSTYSPTVGRVKTRIIQEEEIDKTKPWGFFDGASQNNRCGGGGILYFSESHYFTLTSGLGTGTNNYAELMSLKLLIAFALEKNCKMLIVFGDSKNVINWINGTQRCTNIRLANIVEDIKFLQTAFDSLTCRHVYRERNKEAIVLISCSNPSLGPVQTSVFIFKLFAGVEDFVADEERRGNSQKGAQ